MADGSSQDFGREKTQQAWGQVGEKEHAEPRDRVDLEMGTLSQGQDKVDNRSEEKIRNPIEEKGKNPSVRESEHGDSIDSPRERKSFCEQITTSGKLKIGAGVTFLTIAGFGLVALELYNKWFKEEILDPTGVDYINQRGFNTTVIETLFAAFAISGVDKLISGLFWSKKLGIVAQSQEQEEKQEVSQQEEKQKALQQEEKQKALPQEEKQEKLQQEVSQQQEKQKALPKAKKQEEKQEVLPQEDKLPLTEYKSYEYKSNEYNRQISPSLAWSIATAMQIFQTSFFSGRPVSEKEFGAIRKRLFGLESKYITGAVISVNYLRFTSNNDRRSGKTVCPELSDADQEFYKNNMEPLARALENTNFVKQNSLNDPHAIVSQEFVAQRQLDDLITQDRDTNIFAFSWALYNQEILPKFGNDMDKRGNLIAEYESPLRARKSRVSTVSPSRVGATSPTQQTILGESDDNPGFEAKEFVHSFPQTLTESSSVAFHGSPTTLVSASSPAPVSVPFAPNSSHLGSVQSSLGGERGRTTSS